MHNLGLRRLDATVLVPCVFALAAWASASGPWDELPGGEGQRETYVHCIACHSTKIITQQGLTRADWDETLSWMAAEQGMPELDKATRAVILQYLANTFPPARPHYTAPSD